MEHGKVYSLTVDFKPTKAEALKLISANMDNTGGKVTLLGACKSYIEVKSNVLSTTSIRSYRALTRNIPSDLANKPLHSITTPMIQAEVNRYAVGHAPKTVFNYGAFLSIVMDFFGKSIGRIKYPQRIKSHGYIPTPEELHAILKELEGTPFYIPVFLGSRGLRLSEVCGLTVEDLNGDMLTINKAKVRAEHGYTVKTTKTVTSTRTIAIPHKIADLIREQGYVYDRSPNKILKNLSRAEEKLGIPHFTFHQLRHFFASYTHYLGFVDKSIQYDAGWASNHIMKDTYRQVMDKEKISRQISDIFEQLL